MLLIFYSVKSPFGTTTIKNVIKRLLHHNIADSSLKSSSVLAALKTIHDVDEVVDILGIARQKRHQLRAQHANDDDFRTALIVHYLQTSPYTSWGALGGKCLESEEESALFVCQKKMQHDKGIEKSLHSYQEVSYIMTYPVHGYNTKRGKARSH